MFKLYNRLKISNYLLKFDLKYYSQNNNNRLKGIVKFYNPIKGL